MCFATGRGFSACLGGSETGLLWDEAVGGGVGAGAAAGRTSDRRRMFAESWARRAR